MNTLRRLAHLTRLTRPLRRLLLSLPALQLHARRHGMRLRVDKTKICIRAGMREIIINRGHQPYAHDMVRFFDYYHDAVVSQTFDGIAIVDYSIPRIHTLTRSGVSFHFTSLPESDESTQAYIDFLEPRPGETVLDLGAYCGASAYFIAKAVGANGLVLSLEPDEENFRCLCRNVETHGLTNVTAIPQGVWSETTTLTFQSEGNMGSAAANITGRETNLKKVPVLSLADVAALAKGRRIDAIKMDIEGAELAVLRGAREFCVAHNLPRLVIEPHLIDGRMVTDEICSILRSYGYRTNLLSQGVQNWPLISASPAA